MIRNGYDKKDKWRILAQPDPAILLVFLLDDVGDPVNVGAVEIGENREV